MIAERIKRWPTEERPREQLHSKGAERLTDADLLAIILRTGSGTFKKGVPGKSAHEVALSILKDFRGLRGIDRARIQDLRKVPGLGPAKVAQIKAAFELGKRVCTKKLTAPAFESSLAVASHFHPRFAGRREEMVIAVFLNGQNQLLGEKDTRCNVGSIGVVPDVPKDAITSPEYQVWRLKQDIPEPLLPGYVACLIQTPFFLELVQFNRVGAVKQRMYTENLMQVRIPYVPVKEQQRYADARENAFAELTTAKHRLNGALQEVEAMILGAKKWRCHKLR